MTATATAFRKGDEINLTKPLGPLKPGEYGIVVEVCGEDRVHPVRVSFPRLAEIVRPLSTAWRPGGVDLDSLPKGIPLGLGEFVVTGNLYDRAMADS